MAGTHLLVRLMCLSVRLRGGLQRRVHGWGGIVRSRAVLVPRGEGGVVAQVPTRWTVLRHASCKRKENRNKVSFALWIIFDHILYLSKHCKWGEALKASLVIRL